MDSKTFETLMEEQLDRCRNVLCSKAKEYATSRGAKYAYPQRDEVLRL